MKNSLEQSLSASCEILSTSDLEKQLQVLGLDLGIDFYFDSVVGQSFLLSYQVWVTPDLKAVNYESESLGVRLISYTLLTLFHMGGREGGGFCPPNIRDAIALVLLAVAAVNLASFPIIQCEI